MPSYSPSPTARPFCKEVRAIINTFVFQMRGHSVHESYGEGLKSKNIESRWSIVCCKALRWKAAGNVSVLLHIRKPEAMTAAPSQCSKTGAWHWRKALTPGLPTFVCPRPHWNLKEKAVSANMTAFFGWNNNFYWS